MSILKNLDIPPVDLGLHYLHADFIELLALVHPDRELGFEEIRRRYLDGAVVDIENEFDEIEGDRSTTNDRQTLQILEWLKYIESRSNSYSTSYPFEISNDRIKVSSTLSQMQKLYIYLLMASLLRHFNKSIQTRIGNSFEKLCASAIQLYIGGNATVRLFGTSGDSHYPGNKLDRLRELALDLNESVVADEKEFSPYDSGDEGLDIVSWIQLRDRNPGMIIVFVQCACTEEWEEKQASISFDKWSQLITLSVRPIEMVCVPFSFRDVNGQWFRRRRIHRTLIVDRHRIVSLLASTTSPLSAIHRDIQNILEMTIAFREDY